MKWRMASLRADFSAWKELLLENGVILTEDYQTDTAVFDSTSNIAIG